MKQSALVITLAAVYMAAALPCRAQKETYDAVSYTMPNGWKKEIKENGVQLYTGDEKTGEYTLALIIHSTPSDASGNDNFTAMWEKLVKGTVTVSEAPTMAEPLKDKGWDVVSGQAHYIDGANKGVVTLLTATGGGKLATVVLMANTDKFQLELLAFLHSLEMSEAVTPSGGDSDRTPGAGAAGDAEGTATTHSIPGIWESNMFETSGMRFSNGSPMLTAGYFRHAYIFREDGTYQFLEKDFSVYSREIFFAYEVGTWAVDGNQLTITPTDGKNESWSKSASGSTKEWGHLLKTTPRKLEKISYSFEFHYYSGIKETNLLLKYHKATVRDGNQSNNSDQEHIWSYKPSFTPGQSIIDLPPGEKIAAAKK